MPEDFPLRLGALVRWGASQLGGSASPMLDARALAKAAFGMDDAALILNEDRLLDCAERDRFAAMIARRGRGEPVAHIVGRREFWSLDIEVAPGVLVPRPDSETLIASVLKRRPKSEPLRILDLGCGSGALLCAILHEYPAASGVAVDLNPDAVMVTSRNLDRLGFGPRAAVLNGSWFGPVTGPFDVVISNPPYIPAGERDRLPREVRDFENPLALFAGADGLEAYRTILAACRNYVNPDGLIVLELGAGQADAVKKIATAALPDGRIDIENDLAACPRALVIDLRPAAG